MDLSHGDHDVRFVDGPLEEVFSVDGRAPPASVRLVYDRAVAYYCPSCASRAVVPYSTQPMSGNSSKDSAILEARCVFLSHVLPCESARRLRLVEEVVET